MFYGSSVGVSAVLDRVRKYWGERWAPAALLEKLAAEGRSFAEV
jgi:hypothetical protein